MGVKWSILGQRYNVCKCPDLREGMILARLWKCTELE